MRKHPLIIWKVNCHFSAKDLKALDKPEGFDRCSNALTAKGFQEESETIVCVPPCRCHAGPYPVWANSGRGIDLRSVWHFWHWPQRQRHFWHWPQRQTDGQTSVRP